MNIKEALDKVLAGDGKCATRKSDGIPVYLFDLNRATYVRLEVFDLIATDWRVLKHRPK